MNFDYLLTVLLMEASAEDELGEMVQTMVDVANTAAGSGLHEASCSSLPH